MFEKIDKNELEAVMKYEGLISGYNSGIIYFDKLNKVIEKLQNDLPYAKGIYVNFFINKEQSLFVINDFLTKLHHYCNDNIKIYFEVQTTIPFNTNQCKVSILLSGINKSIYS